MKIDKFLVLIVIMLTSCAPAQGQPASTPTVTLPLTATPAPSPTATSTPIPTPMGGSGKLLVVVDHVIKVINPTHSDEKILIAREDFEKEFSLTGGFYYKFSRISPDGQKILVGACKEERADYPCSQYNLYLSNTDGSLQTTVGSLKGVPVWSPDSKRFLIASTNPKTGKPDYEFFTLGVGTFIGLGQIPSATAAFWSYDGSLIYYYDKGWFTAKNDGTDPQALKCDLCKLASEPSAYAVAQSPNGQMIGIGTVDGTVIITTPDLTSFKFAALQKYINRVDWSPDSTRLAVDTNTGSSSSDIVIVGADGTVIKQLSKPEGIRFVSTCGWSPDGQSVDYIALRSDGADLYLQPLDVEAPILLLSFKAGEDSCPVWLTDGTK